MDRNKYKLMFHLGYDPKGIYPILSHQTHLSKIMSHT
jgi:hypothetical protein